MKHPSELTLPVELTFEVLPPIEVEGIMLPEQIDITKVRILLEL